jgi:predicted P-loop ATPase/GTPase
MNLEQLQQEADKLKAINPAALSPEQLSELITKLSSILDQSEESLINTSLIELNTNENESNDDL